MMGIDELMDLTMYSSMYLLFYMAYFYVEGANLLVPCRVNANFKRILSRFASFFRGFIGAGGWRASASQCDHLDGNLQKIHSMISSSTV